jgi:hypothetical protein
MINSPFSGAGLGFSLSDRKLGRAIQSKKFDPDLRISGIDGLDPAAPLSLGVSSKYHFRPAPAKRSSG